MSGAALGAPALLYGRCNPYGHESGGPRRLLGGIYGPEHEGPTKWTCERAAGGRFRMVCRCEHRGQPMPLCLPGIVTGASGKTFVHPGHVAEISRRQSDSCPRCLFPPEAAELATAAEKTMYELAAAERAGFFNAQTRALSASLERMQARLDEMNQSGRIHKCPLTLVEVS